MKRGAKNCTDYNTVRQGCQDELWNQGSPLGFGLRLTSCYNHSGARRDLGEGDIETVSACVFCDIIQGDALHVHLHVIPRFRGDGLGFRFGPDYCQRPGRALLARVAEDLRQVLED